MLNVLDLFSGIGGFSLGLERTGGFKTIAFCEIEEFPRKVLKKHWPDVPCFEDVRKLHASDIEGTVDVICGGYPCQPFSCAGKREGQNDDRHLWPEIARLLREFDALGRKPTWCVFENVGGHVSMGLDEVLSELESQGYSAWPVIIPACSINAPHRRDRVWIIANDGSQRTKRVGTDDQNEIIRAEFGAKSCGSDSVASISAQQLLNGAGVNGQEGRIEYPIGGGTAGDPTSPRLPQRESGEGGEIQDQARGQKLERRDFRLLDSNPNGARRKECDTPDLAARSGHGSGGINPQWGEPWIEAATRLCRVDDGLPRGAYRTARLKALGNSIVPQVVEMIGRAILAAQ